MNNEIREILDNPKILQLSYGNYVSLDDYNELKFVYENDVQEIKALVETMKYKEMDFCKLHDEVENYKSRVEKAVEQAKEKIKRYESYINDLKKGNYPSPTIRQERQELIFRIREQEDLLNILQGNLNDE